MKQLLFIACLLFTVSCTVHNSNFISGGEPVTDSDLPSSEPGKCYARCLISDKYGLENDTLLMFAGADVTQPGVESKIIEVSPASSKWVKIPDKNCLSANPEDCLIWCLEKTPAQTRTLTTVVDTTLVKEFNAELVETKYLEDAGGYTEWREVICQNEISSEFVLELRESLIAEGYQVELGKDKIDGELKKVLKKYQIDHYLPIGQLDVETLAKLGVR